MHPLRYRQRQCPRPSYSAVLWVGLLAQERYPATACTICHMHEWVNVWVLILRACEACSKSIYHMAWVEVQGSLSTRVRHSQFACAIQPMHGHVESVCLLFVHVRRDCGIHEPGDAAARRDGHAGRRVQLCHDHAGALVRGNRLQGRQLTSSVALPIRYTDCGFLQVHIRLTGRSIHCILLPGRPLVLISHSCVLRPCLKCPLRLGVSFIRGI